MPKHIIGYAPGSWANPSTWTVFGLALAYFCVGGTSANPAAALLYISRANLQRRGYAQVLPNAHSSD